MKVSEHRDVGAAEDWVELTGALLGHGVERLCFEHPDDEDLVVKVCHSKRRKQINREIRYFQRLGRRLSVDQWRHMPRYVGAVQTVRGRGFVQERIRNADGTASDSLHVKLFDQRHAPEDYASQLSEMHDYFIDHRVMFNYDILPKNVLIRERSASSTELVLIDGFGDTVAIPILNLSRRSFREKQRRRWNRFVEVMSDRELMIAKGPDAT